MVRRAAVLCAGLLWSCAPAGAPELGVRRQAAVGPPEVVGNAGSRLGSALAVCPDGGFVAGAPGTGTAWLLTEPAMPPAQGNGLGRAVACLRGTTGKLMVAGGDAGVRRDTGAGWVPFVTASSTFSLSRSDDGALPLLVGGASNVQFFDQLTSQLIYYSTSAPGFGSAVLWFPSGPRFAVAQVGAVVLYDYLSDGGPATPWRTISNPAIDFGRALAIGDFLPPSGEEIAIGSEGVVFVYDRNGVLLQQLTGADLSFGAALAVERAYMGFTPRLDVLWVGAPAFNQVYQFVGDAGTIQDALDTVAHPGAQFGASLAIDSARRMVAIGAPGYQSSTGAVFLDQRSGLTFGEPMACVAGRDCVTPMTCEMGTCVGGVLCETSSSPDPFCLVPQETCDMQGNCVLPDGGVRTFDAGQPPLLDGGVAGTDAGQGTTLDGGLDAGTPSGDAGSPDGGTPPADAGTTPGDGGPASDAGAVTSDGGDLSDAGSKDGGSGPDGGSKDAGVGPGPDEKLTFTTCGCSGGAALPLLLLGLALARRRHFPLRGRGMA